ncbi:MAG: methionyl-tRNA formyltransferase [bacterium]|nr:methionyl-tRNA formyltransferase [bacterium]
MGNGKLVFFGTSDICLPFLEVLRREYDLRLIITPPDAFGGRNRKKVIVPAVKTFALEHDIPLMQPEKLGVPEVMAAIRAVEADIGVVIAYGKLIPARVYRIPKFRMVNVHFSLLPLYRGAAPVQRALQDGCKETSVSIFELVKQMDAGPMWAQKTFSIEPCDTTACLWERLSREGAGFLNETVKAILAGTIEKTPQDESRMTLAPPVRKGEGKMDWNQSAQRLYDQFRAFTPWPGVYCDSGDKRFKLTKMRVCDLSHDKQPGYVLEMNQDSLKICCGEGSVLEILEMQPQGKKPMSPFAYCRGNELPETLD